LHGECEPLKLLHKLNDRCGARAWGRKVVYFHMKYRKKTEEYRERLQRIRL